MTTSEPQTAYDYQDGRIRLVRLPDGYELDPPWGYSDNAKMSLGVGRFQLEVDDSMTDEEIGRRIRARFGMAGRRSLLDVHAFMPTG